MARLRAQMRWIPQVLLVVGLLACARAHGARRPAGVVTQAQLRAEIDRYVCAEWLVEHQLYEARFNDRRCADRTVDREALVTDIVRRGAGQWSAVNVLASAAYEWSYTRLAGSNGSPDQVVRDAYWADPHLGPVALAQSSLALAAEGWRCPDCPVPVVEALTVVSWGDFRTYVAAYLWPVRALDSTQILACGATNGVNELRLVDQQLIDAGFLSAAALAEDTNARASVHAIGVDAISLEGARDSILDFLDSELARRVVCRRIAETQWYTRLRVDGC